MIYYYHRILIVSKISVYIFIYLRVHLRHNIWFLFKAARENILIL